MCIIYYEGTEELQTSFLIQIPLYLYDRTRVDTQKLGHSTREGVYATPQIQNRYTYWVRTIKCNDFLFYTTPLNFV